MRWGSIGKNICCASRRAWLWIPAHILKLGMETGALLRPLECQSSSRLRETLSQRNKARNDRAGHQCNLWPPSFSSLLLLCFIFREGHIYHRLSLNSLIFLSYHRMNTCVTTPDYFLLFIQSGPQLVERVPPTFRVGLSASLNFSVNTLRNTHGCVSRVILHLASWGGRWTRTVC